ncbi:unnamed protein product, partial [Amoebophrya sp. A120]
DDFDIDKPWDEIVLDIAAGRVNRKKVFETPVTVLCKHLPDLVLERTKKYFETKQIRLPKEPISISGKTKQHETHETVSEITGTAIPAYFEFQLTKGRSLAILQALFSAEARHP